MSTDRMAVEPSSNVLREHVAPLSAFTNAHTIAVVGASERPGSVGRALVENLLAGSFSGRVIPINPKRAEVLGIPTIASLEAVRGMVDLAIIATPAATVPSVVREAIAADVRGAIVISAGFAELGDEGRRLADELRQIARSSPLRLLGPNCLGALFPWTGINASFASRMPLTGQVAFLSQSGALCTAILDWSLRERVGFSAFVSLGGMVDLSWGDWIDHLGSDPKTKSIVLYMESIGDARHFMSAAREVAQVKPILVLKAGRTAEASKAAASHTGSMTGRDEVLDAAFRRAGVLRVDDLSELFALAEVLDKQPLPAGPRLAIVTNAGGLGVLATDGLLGAGGQLAELAPETIEKLDSFLPAAWSRANPVDILGDAEPERFAQATAIVAQDPAADGILLVATPQAMTQPTQAAEKLRPFAKHPNKPMLASWMGGAEMAAGDEVLANAGYATFPYPDLAARAFVRMVDYRRQLNLLYETPMRLEGDSTVDRQRASEVLQSIHAEGRTLATEIEAKVILAAYRIPTTPMQLALSADEAVRAAEELGYPVVLKVHSTTVTHKSDLGGVQLDLANEAQLRAGYDAIHANFVSHGLAEAVQGVTIQPMVRQNGFEVILGSSVDPQFGPVLLFGSGGTLVEIYQDRALGLPPLTRTLARLLMSETKVYGALQGARGRPPANLDALADALVRLGELVVDHPSIAEADLNPVLAGPKGVLALDARLILRPNDAPPATRPAIRPYPNELVRDAVTKDDAPIRIRPIRPEDEQAMVQFHQDLSPETVRMRYFYPMKLSKRIEHQRLIRVCFTDYDRNLALVVEPREEEHRIVAIGRLIRLPHALEAEFAILVSDAWQRRGLGTLLLGSLVEFGRAEGLKRIVGQVLPENTGMLNVARKLGFRLERSLEDPTVQAVLDLPGNPK